MIKSFMDLIVILSLLISFIELLLAEEKQSKH